MIEEIKNRLEVTFPRKESTLNETLQDMLDSNTIKDFLVFNDDNAFECYVSSDGENFTRVILGKL